MKQPFRMILAFLPLFFAGSLARATEAERIQAALTEALGLYQAEFQAEEGRPLADELLGFEWQRLSNESNLLFFEVKGSDQLGAELYGCHEHGDEAHCDYEESKKPQSYQVPLRNFKLNEMRTAFGEALQLIASRIQPLDQFTSIKIWQDGHDLQVAARSDRGVSALMCHHHAGALDCHRQRQVGAGEPQF